MSNFLAPLIIAVLAAVFTYMFNQTNERFWMTPSRTLKVEKVYADPPNGFFSIPNYQSQLSPRFSNVDYGANLRTEFPDPQNLAVPFDPLDGQPGYLGGSYKTSPSSENTNFFNEDGTAKQPILYDRYIYANRNSRLRGLGDPIRGDLPIVPISGNWFVPSAAFTGPNIVLQQGAMNVMGGVNNETSNQLASLIYNSSGGTETNMGDVDMSQYRMGNSFYGTTAGGDVKVTAFP